MNFYFIVSLALAIIGAGFGGIIMNHTRMYKLAQAEFEQEIRDALHAHDTEMEEAISTHIDGGGGWL